MDLKLIGPAKNAQTTVVRCCFDVATALHRCFVILFYFHYEIYLKLTIRN